MKENTSEHGKRPLRKEIEVIELELIASNISTLSLILSVIGLSITICLVTLIYLLWEGR